MFLSIMPPGATEMAQQVKALSINPDDLSQSPDLTEQQDRGTSRTEGLGNIVFCSVSCLLTLKTKNKTNEHFQNTDTAHCAYSGVTCADGIHMTGMSIASDISLSFALGTFEFPSAVVLKCSDIASHSCYRKLEPAF